MVNTSRWTWSWIDSLDGLPAGVRGGRGQELDSCASEGHQCGVDGVRFVDGTPRLATWASARQVRTVPWVTAESRCRRGASRRYDPLRALPSTAMTAARAGRAARVPVAVRWRCGVGRPGGRPPPAPGRRRQQPPARRRLWPPTGAPPSEQVVADADGLQQCVRGTLAPLGEFVDAPGSRDDRTGTHQQDRCQRVPPAPPCTGVGHRVEVRAQVRDPVLVQRPRFHQRGGDGRGCGSRHGYLMIIGLRHHNDHEARACLAVHPSRSPAGHQPRDAMPRAAPLAPPGSLADVP